MVYFLTLDLGTTSVKVALVDELGHVVSFSLQEYFLDTPSKDIVELDPEIYWQSCCKGIKDVLNRSCVEMSHILSVAASSQGETLILIGKDGNPLRKAIVWMDNRSGLQADLIRGEFDSETIINTTGQPDIIPAWPITKILWLKENELDIYKNVYKYLLVEDYIIYRLTGKFVGEYSLYTSSFMLDINRKKWWDDIINLVGVKKDQLVDLYESGQKVGKIKRNVSDELGLCHDVEVITGAMDQTAGMIGGGNIKNGIITETTGAALAICATVDKFPANNKGQIAVQYHAIADKYLLLGWCPTGGMALRWLRDTFFSEELKSLKDKDIDLYSVMTDMAEKVAPGSQGLLFMPYLAGMGTPIVNSNVRGSFRGIELQHNRSHFVRAVMESIAFVLKDNIDAMEEMGVRCDEIRSLGGGAKSELWNQVKADVSSKKIVKMDVAEAGSIGTAILQAVAIGRYSNIEEAVDKMVKTSAIIEPDQQNVNSYQEIYEKFLKISKSIL